MPDENCRLGQLEGIVRTIQDQFKEDRLERERQIVYEREQFQKVFDELFAAVRDIRDSVQEQKLTMEKQRSFIGGVVFVVGGLASVATALWHKYL